MKSKSDKKDIDNSASDTGRFVAYLLSLFSLGVAALIWLSVISYHPADPPTPGAYPASCLEIQNKAGYIGALVSNWLRNWFGVSVYVGLTILTYWAIRSLVRKKLTHIAWRLIGLGLLVSAFAAAAYIKDPTMPSANFANTNFGKVGKFFGLYLSRGFGHAGSWIILCMTSCLGLLFAAEEVVSKFWNMLLTSHDGEKKQFAKSLAGRLTALKQAWQERAQKRREHREQKLAEKQARLEQHRQNAKKLSAQIDQIHEEVRQAEQQEINSENQNPTANKPSILARIFGKKSQPASNIESRNNDDVTSLESSEIETGNNYRPVAFDENPNPVESEYVPASSQQEVYDEEYSQPIAPESAEEKTKFKHSPAAVVSAPKVVHKPKKLKNNRKVSKQLPSMDLLENPVGGYSEAAELQAVQRKQVLQRTLDDFGVQATVVGFQTGPVITLFEVALAPGVKTTAISNLSLDIARSLAVPGVRIVPPRFGKDTVGIEVPNLEKETVRLKELMHMQPKAEKKLYLPMYLGKDAGGDAIVTDLAKCPHMLIAGTTGSGKSVCINTIIMSLLMTRSADDVRFIMVDPKMVEMAAFEKLPHLLCPTITDMKKAEDILEWACVKMDERYEMLKEVGEKNIVGYNSLGEDEVYHRLGIEDEEDKLRVQTRLPYYVVIIDELADLMMTSTKEVESYIIRIAQKARAVGIHLVLATQRPSANVVTGLIKSNMPCRVSFRVASGQESRIVLDQKGAEILLGQGDMLVLQPGQSTLDRAQGTFVDDNEIRAVVKEIEQTGEQKFDASLMQIQTGSGGGSLSEDRDELFDKAVEIVLSTKRGSVSLLQRRMSVGYGRASRIIDQMADAGILGEHKGSQARECMITLDDWHDMQKGIQRDMSGDNSLNGQGTSW